jgi:hypothetical protein
MSREILLPPARRLLIFLAMAAVATSAVLALGTAPAAAAKPCWERVIDDWVDNARFDGSYSAACIEQARRHIPEDVRAYSDIEEKLDAYRQLTSRKPSGGDQGPTTGNPTTAPSDEEPAPAGDPTTTNTTRDSGPFVEVMNPNTTSADSIPLPLILLAGLALLLMAAGATGIAHRKLQARRANVRRPS